ncbi:MAG: 3-phosphoserine/phosphohydroxythreonine transaminase [Candidatus Omnitrophota bacterium]|jgi:phosphoserine aminotransferase|nr:MAG: 3-phosphoserine/phosphohydroxythreonine transaminase [Candidatus Omnitrophota bacterium]
MEKRVYNFSPGPAVLPLSVLKEAQEHLISLPGVGMSILEISHRSKYFKEILDEVKTNLRTLLSIPEHYAILFLQGGATQQFSLVPMNFLRGSGKSSDYVVTGSWGKKAIKVAQAEGSVNAVWNGASENFKRIPQAAELKFDPNAAYAHFTSNETIQGVQFFEEPNVGDVPLICDASSDFLCRPIAMEKYGLLYAGAQKNAGPAGVTIVIIRNDLLERIPDGIHEIFNYRELVKNDSTLNTPPVFAVYVVMLVTRWLLNHIGGLAKMEEINRRKAQVLYDAIDQSGGFYKGHAAKEDRSLMNVTWTMTNPEIEQEFIANAQGRGLYELKGHRSVGGFRASIYNAMPIEGIELLRDYMIEFQKQHG